MSLYTSIWSFNHRAWLESLVDRVTARAQNAVWRRVRDQIPGMTVHQSRGYIRARATAVIQREVGILMAEEPSLSPPQLNWVTQAVRHRVVRRLLFENLRRFDRRPIDRREAA